MNKMSANNVLALGFVIKRSNIMKISEAQQRYFSMLRQPFPCE